MPWLSHRVRVLPLFYLIQNCLNRFWVHSWLGQSLHRLRINCEEASLAISRAQKYDRPVMEENRARAIFSRQNPANSRCGGGGVRKTNMSDTNQLRSNRPNKLTTNELICVHKLPNRTASTQSAVIEHLPLFGSPITPFDVDISVAFSMLYVNFYYSLFRSILCSASFAEMQRTNSSKQKPKIIADIHSELRTQWTRITFYYVFLIYSFNDSTFFRPQSGKCCGDSTWNVLLSSSMDVVVSMLCVKTIQSSGIACEAGGRRPTSTSANIKIIQKQYRNAYFWGALIHSLIHTHAHAHT